MSAKSPQKVVSKNGSFYVSNLEGYHKHPRLNLWAREGCSYFLNDHGHKLAHEYSPARRAKSKGRGYRAPSVHRGTSKACHVVMGEIFYGERKIFFDQNGKPYYGICHHLIEDPLNYCMENLLCWLSRSEHSKADYRRRALEKLVPDGNLNGFDYTILRELQDPRTMSDEDFQSRLAYIQHMRYCSFDPRIFTAADFHHWFSMPFEEFKSFFEHYKND